MKSKPFWVLLSLAGGIVLFVLPAFSSDFLVKKPPASLDSLYRDQDSAGKWILQMRKLSGAFDDALRAAERKDWAEAGEKARAFAERYREAAEWVPEWKDYFDFAAADRFVKSLQSQKQDRIQQASKKLTATCDRCHADNSLAVWVRYTWPETSEIKITDPVEETEMAYRDYMHLLSRSLRGITHHFEREEFDRAWRHVFQFKKRIVELRSVCSKCHITEWTKNGSSVKQFFVGNRVLDSVDRVSKLFATGEPDAKKFWKEIDGIARHSCRMCHLIHQPAVHIQNAWKQKE